MMSICLNYGLFLLCLPVSFHFGKISDHEERVMRFKEKMEKENAENGEGNDPVTEFNPYFDIQSVSSKQISEKVSPGW